MVVIGTSKGKTQGKYPATVAILSMMAACQATEVRKLHCLKLA
jgi:hypothetical protein